MGKYADHGAAADAEIAALTAQVAALQQALDECEAVEEEEPPPPPPPVTLVPMLGNDAVYEQQNFIADWVASNKLTPRAVPWDTRLYFDAPNKVFARPMNGQVPARVRAWHPWGVPTGLYSTYPTLSGKPYSPQAGDNIKAIADDLAARPTPVGPRGIALPSPYGTGIGHITYFPPGAPNAGQKIPGAPVWMWLQHDGQLQMFHDDRSVQSAGKIAGIAHCNDFCLDSVERKFMYVADIGTSTTGTSWTGGRIAKVDRTNGMIPGAQDATLYTTTTFLGGLVYPTAVDIDEAQNVYAVDFGTGKIYKNQAVLATIPSAFAGRYHAGKFWTFTRGLSLYSVDVATGVAELKSGTGASASVSIGSDFFTMSIDRWGTFGPVGNIIITASHGLSSTAVWIWDGVSLKTAWTVHPTNFGYAGVGDLRYVKEAFHHYPWAGVYHPDQGIALVAGFTGTVSELVALKVATDHPAQETDQELNRYNRMSVAWGILKKGGSLNSPFDKPSLTCLVSREGSSAIPGCSADEVAMMAFDDAEAFIRGGMAGSFRRDDLTNVEMLNLLIFLYGNSMRYLAEGGALMTALKNWWIGKYGAIPAFAWPPSNYTEQKNDIIKAKLTNGVLTAVIYRSTHATTETPPAHQIIADEGMPGETILTNGTPLPGTHAYTVRAAGWWTSAVIVSA